MTELAGRWLRVSTGGQDERNQEPDIDRHITGNGYRAARTYTLHGKSASKGEQEAELENVVRDIKDGVITVLVAWSLDRLDRRGIAESFRTKLRIEEAGGRVEFALEPTMDELSFAVKAYMAQQESQRKAERSRIGLDTARANGGAIGKPPWGYRTAGPKRAKRWEPTAEGRRYVPEIFGRIAGGQSLNQVAAWLTAHGPRKVVESTGKSVPWHGRVLGKMIRNTAYMGFAQDGAFRCPALVDAGLWQQANDALNGSRHRKTGPNGAKSPLAGVLRCGKCQAVMYRIHGERGSSAIYRCTGGHGVTVPCAVLENWVDRQLAGHGGFVLREVTVPGKNWDAEIKAAEHELSTIDRRIADWDTQDAERARLRTEIRRLRELPAVPARTEEEVLPITVGDCWQMLATWDRKREFLRAASITIYATRDSYRLDGDPTRLGTSGELWSVIENLLGKAHNQ